jgi:hypothetical protein
LPSRDAVRLTGTDFELNAHRPVAWPRHPDNGEQVLLNRVEKHASWAWVDIEVLRHTGIRVEELLELTHLVKARDGDELIRESEQLDTS